MFCGQCGKNLPDDVRFCQSCGRPNASTPMPSSFTNAAASVAPALSSSSSARNREPSATGGRPNVASGPLAAAVAPALEQEPLRPAPATIPVTVDPLKGIRGWLLLFWVGCVVVKPVFLFFEVVNSKAFEAGVAGMLGAGFDFLLGALWIYTGIALWRVAANALRLVKVGFVVTLILATVDIAIGILTAAHASQINQTPTQNDLVGVGGRLLISVWIWWSYFKKSKRVKATYGANL